MVYLTAKTATHLYKSPSSFDLTAKSTLYSTLPTVRFKPTNLRLHTSTWTLGSSGSGSQKAFESFTTSGSPTKSDDPSMLLLSPYSKSCYLLAQANRSKSLYDLNSASVECHSRRLGAFPPVDQRPKQRILLVNQKSAFFELGRLLTRNGHITAVVVVVG